MRSRGVRKPKIPVVEQKTKETVLPDKLPEPVAQVNDQNGKEMHKKAEKESQPDAPKPTVTRVLQKPTLPPVKYRHVQPKPLHHVLMPPPNPEVVTSTHHHKSESSKTIAELINERNMMQRKQEMGLVDPKVDSQHKNNGYTNQVNRMPIPHTPMLPILQCMKSTNVRPSSRTIVNGRSESNNVPIAPKPPTMIRIYDGKTGNATFRSNGLDINGIHKVLPGTGQPHLTQLKIKVSQKRKARPGDEQTPAKVQKVSFDVKPSKSPAVSTVPPDNAKASVVAPAKDVNQHAGNGAKDECDQNANPKPKEVAEDGVVPKLPEKESDDPPGVGTVNDAKQSPGTGTKFSTFMPSSEDKMRESPPPDSLVIVTSSPEDSLKSLSPSLSNGTKTDDRTAKEKSRKQKSLDEVVKTLALFGKEAPKSSDALPQDTDANDESKKDIDKTKSGPVGRSSYFSPLDLSRKHLNLPVIPVCPTAKMFPAAGLVPVKSPNRTPPDSAIHAGRNIKVQQGAKKVSNNNNIKHISPSSASATTSTNGCTKTTMPQVQINHHHGGSRSPKSPTRRPKNLMAPLPPVSLTPLSPYLVPPLYGRQQLELISKYSPQLLNTAMLYSSMVGSAAAPRSPVPKSTKKL